MEITTSFDNITITAHVKESKIKKLKYIIENEVAIYVKRSSFDRFEAFTKSGNSEILHISYDKIKGQAFQARPFRLEFNPNKLRDKDISIYKDIISLLYDITISRLDLAFDIFDVDCSKFVFEKLERNVKSSYYLSASGVLETKYLGARKSEKRARLYNKKIERTENGGVEDNIFASKYKHWWRLEFQLRSRSVDNVFEIIDEYIFKPQDFSDLSIDNQMKISIFLNDKNLWGKLSRNTRSKYKKILKNYSTNDIDYKSLLRKDLNENRDRLEKQLRQYAGREEFEMILDKIK